MGVVGVAGSDVQGQDPGELTRWPYVQRLGRTSADILWRTSTRGTGHVRYWGPAEEPKVATEAEPGFVHRVSLSSLEPGTVYEYEVLQDDRVLTETYRFRTDPGRDGTIRAAVIGDSGSANANQLAVASLVQSRRPDVFLHTGDLVYVGSFEYAVFTMYKEVYPNTCFYPIPGNHDLGFQLPQDFAFPRSISPEGAVYYSFDSGSAHFAALDSTEWHEEARDEQLTWLRSDLADAKEAGARWLVVYFHYTVYTIGAYAGSGADLGPRDSIPPIADELGVDLVLTGHDHNYQQTHPLRAGAVVDGWQAPDYVSPRGTIYVVTGGGGGVLYGRRGGPDTERVRRFESAHHAVELDISPATLVVRALGVEGETIDEFSIRKDRPRPTLQFVRGDVTVDGRVNLSDAVALLGHLFLGQPAECLPTLDVTSIGGPPGIGDAIYVLNHLFLGGPPPAPPYPECGAAQGIDEDSCRRTPCRPAS
jgi:hypothetical protein